MRLCIQYQKFYTFFFNNVENKLILIQIRDTLYIAKSPSILFCIYNVRHFASPLILVSGFSLFNRSISNSKNFFNLYLKFRNFTQILYFCLFEFKFFSPPKRSYFLEVRFIILYINTLYISEFLFQCRYMLFMLSQIYLQNLVCRRGLC